MRMTSAWVYYPAAVLLILACGAGWLATLLTLPGNWVVVLFAALFAWLYPEEAGRGISWHTVGWLVALAAVGEVIEFVSGAAGAAKQGASRRAVVLSVVGAIVGTVVGLGIGMPIPIVGPIVVAVLGGALGAFAGAYLGEWHAGRAEADRFAAGQGAFIGKLWGTLGKLATGAVMLVIVAVDALV
jgi:uncharacterized protein YqgC (DUF456 family)